MIIVALLASVLGCAPPSDTSVVGFWESEAVSRGGIGDSIELKTNGEWLRATTAILDQVYRVGGGKLFMADSAQDLDRTTDGPQVPSPSSGTRTMSVFCSVCP